MPDTLRKAFWFMAATTATVINTSSLLPGIYLVRYSRGSYNATAKLNKL